MGKIIEFDDNEVEVLSTEMAYLIRKETAEYERLVFDRKASRVWDERTHDKFILTSETMLGVLKRIHSKLTH